MKIGDALIEISRETRLSPTTLYKLLGVKWYGKGVFLREEKYGREIKANKLYAVKQGDFIYNRLFAWKGSFAIIPQEYNGCLVSSEFPLFATDENKLLPGFLLNYLLLPETIAVINNLSGGMSSVSRKRFKVEDFLNFEIPEYKIELQKTIFQRLKLISDTFSIQEFKSNNQFLIINQLRQQVIQEAFQGKLTDGWRQEHPELISGENHASKVLERIKIEKERTTKESKFIKEKALPPINDSEKPFDLPNGWVFCRLGELSEWIYGSGLAKTYYKADGKYPVYGSNGIVGYYDKYLTPKRSIIVGRKGSAGALNKSDMPSWTTDVAFYVEESKFINFEYLFLLLNSLNLADIGKGIKPGINRNEVYNLIVPISPLDEQRVIVNRVDKLLDIIDQLKRQISERKEFSKRLIQSVLRESFTMNQRNLIHSRF